LRIYVLPVNKIIQPDSSWLIYPEHNGDYGLEQDFLNYLQNNGDLLTDNPQEADYHYLPVFWTRWGYNHNWGKADIDILRLYVEQAILDDSKTFTICQIASGPKVDVGKTIVFVASRGDNSTRDVPLISRPHPLPLQLPEKKYLASFVGRLDTHPIRTEMAEYFKDIPDTYIIHRTRGADFFIEKILESYITLCPRGCGGSSYRFFETMQLGGVPFLIGKPDTRPFKKYINWDEYSFYAESPQEAAEMLKSCCKNHLPAMGDKCAKLWKENLCYGKWCDYVLRELSDLTKESKELQH
jgi:hypothetical protein